MKEYQGEMLGKRITSCEVAQFRRPTGDNSNPMEYDIEGLKKYCGNMGYIMPDLTKKGEE